MVDVAEGNAFRSLVVEYCLKRADNADAAYVEQEDLRVLRPRFSGVGHFNSIATQRVGGLVSIA